MPELIGRDEELHTLERFLAGRSGVLLLEGEAGIGKTSAWEAGLDRARAAGHRVLASRAAQAEAQISFAAVADLLAGEADALAALAEPQRRSRWRCCCATPRAARRSCRRSPSRCSRRCARSPPRRRCCSRSTTPSGSTRRRRPRCSSRCAAWWPPAAPR